MQGTQVQPWSRKIPRAVGQLSPCTTTTEIVPQPLSPTHLEPVPCSKRSCCEEKSAHRNEEQPWLAAATEKLEQPWRPSTAKSKLKKNFNALSPSTEEWIKMWYIYTMEYYSVIKKKQNNAICRKMDVCGDCHTEWSKSEKEKYHFYVESFLKNYRNELIY